MNKILCTDYSSRICTELNCNEPNFMFYITSFTFVVIYAYLRLLLILCRMHSCVLTAFTIKRISIDHRRNQFVDTELLDTSTSQNYASTLLCCCTRIRPTAAAAVLMRLLLYLHQVLLPLRLHQ